MEAMYVSDIKKYVSQHKKSLQDYFRGFFKLIN